MAIITKKANNRVYTFGSGCAIEADKLLSDYANIFFNAFSNEIVTASDFEIIDVNLVPSGHFHAGNSHEYVNGVIQGVNGYLPPLPAVLTSGRDLNAKEFRTVGIKYNSIVFDNLLAIPTIAAFLDDYKEINGIKFNDATDPNSNTAALFTLAKAKNVITDQQVAGFLAKWVELYPSE